MAVEFPECDADLDRLVKLEPVEIIIAKSEVPPRAQAEVDRIQLMPASGNQSSRPIDRKLLISILRIRAIRLDASNTAGQGLAVSVVCR